MEELLEETDETFAIYVAQELSSSSTPTDCLLRPGGFHESDKCVCANLLQENS